MNKQEIFDTVVKHLFDQKGPATSGGSCKYRHEGRKCAVGCLIPDDLYEECMEGSSILPLLSAHSQFPAFFHLNSSLLYQLQGAHDQSWVNLKSRENTWDYAILNEKLTFVAQEFELNRDVLDAEMSLVLTPIITIGA